MTRCKHIPNLDVHQAGGFEMLGRCGDRLILEHQRH
jgi:hypothetical protein